MENELAVEAIGLEKAYGRVRVLDGVDLEVARGSVLALLGPNGAGKTTTVRILATLGRPDAGQARVAGFDVVTERRQVRRHISLTGQFAAVGRPPDRRGEPAHDGPAGRACPGPRPAAAPASCWSSSTWPRPAAARSRPGRAACAGASTWPPAWSGSRR